MTHTTSSPVAAPSAAVVAAEALTFHALPIQTDFTGTTDIRENFIAGMTRNSSDARRWQASLRGRALVGEEVHLPQGYAVALTRVSTGGARATPCVASACVARASSREAHDAVEVEEEVAVEACAPCFVLWEHDRAPTAAATIPQSIDLAEVLHSSTD